MKVKVYVVFSVNRPTWDYEGVYGSMVEAELAIEGFQAQDAMEVDYRIITEEVEI